MGRAHEIDLGKRRLLLQIRSGSKPETFREIAIDLATGTPLQPKQHLFPKDHGTTHIRYAAESQVLTDALNNAAPITYPPLAKQARIQGTVVADCILDGSMITSVSIRSGHPASHGRPSTSWRNHHHLLWPWGLMHRPMREEPSGRNNTCPSTKRQRPHPDRSRVRRHRSA